MIQNLCRSKEAPFLSTLAVIGGKWKMRILYELSCDSILRDGMIIRKEYPRVPPKVEYSLSDKGKTFVPIINAMCDWGKAYPINSSFGTH